MISITPGIGRVPSVADVTVYPSVTTTYILTAANAIGSANAAVIVVVSASPPPATLFVASPLLTYFDVALGSSKTMEVTADPSQQMDLNLVITPQAGTPATAFSVVGAASFIIRNKQTIQIKFSPAASGPMRARLDLRVPGYNISQSVDLSGGGADPAGRMVSEIRNAAAGGSFLAPNTWMTITGIQLSSTTRSWDPSDFRDTAMPTSLDGVEVTVDKQAAYLSYVSDSQINILTPISTSADRIVEVAITYNGVKLNPFLIRRLASAPGIFTFSQGQGKYAAAAFADWSYVGTPGLLAPDYPTRPAKPGDLVYFFLNGLGPTATPAPEGHLFSDPIPLARPISITIGGRPATVHFVYLVSPGLFQVAATIPEVASGDQNIVVSTDEDTTQKPVTITIRI